MAHYKRGLSGNQAAAKGGTEALSGAGRDNRKHAAFWVSHRHGPFLIHDNKGSCEQQPNDNVGYLDNYEAAIEQGFAPCPKCSSGGAA
jgi:hypothetical protein